MPAQDQKDTHLSRRLANAERQKKLKGTPLQSVPAYRTPSFIPGIPHTLEGAPTGLDLLTGLKSAPTGPTADNPEENIRYKRQLGEMLTHNRETEGKLAVFTEEQEARKRIQSIVDPDDVFLNAERQRAAARRRMRGRIGTILTSEDKLGGGAKL